MIDDVIGIIGRWSSRLRGLRRRLGAVAAIVRAWPLPSPPRFGWPGFERSSPGRRLASARAAHGHDSGLRYAWASGRGRGGDHYRLVSRRRAAARTSFKKRIDEGVHPLTYSILVPVFFISSACVRTAGSWDRRPRSRSASSWWLSWPRSSGAAGWPESAGLPGWSRCRLASG